jgi:hypothetical protein
MHQDHQDAESPHDAAGEAFTTAEIIHCSPFEMQVCVPADWSNSDIERFANYLKPGATAWNVKAEREACRRKNYVHVTLGPALLG